MPASSSARCIRFSFSVAAAFAWTGLALAGLGARATQAAATPPGLGNLPTATYGIAAIARAADAVRRRKT